MLDYLRNWLRKAQPVADKPVTREELEELTMAIRSAAQPLIDAAKALAAKAAAYDSGSSAQQAQIDALTNQNGILQAQNTAYQQQIQQMQQDDTDTDAALAAALTEQPVQSTDTAANSGAVSQQ